MITTQNIYYTEDSGRQLLPVLQSKILYKVELPYNLRTINLLRKKYNPVFIQGSDNCITNLVYSNNNGNFVVGTYCSTTTEIIENLFGNSSRTNLPWSMVTEEIIRIVDSQGNTMCYYDNSKKGIKNANTLLEIVNS